MKEFSEILTHLQYPARFFFLRHGESEGNVEGRMQGHLDRALTDLGRQQAETTGRWFAEHAIEIGTVLSSPLSRAMDTATIVAREAGYPAPSPIDSAKELDTGKFTDMSIAEIRSQYPDEYAEFIVGSWASVPDAESVSSLTMRALQTWSSVVDIANASGGGGILTVTHGGMMQWIVKSSFGATPDQPVPWMPLVLASNCAVFQFQARPVRSTDRDGRPLRWYYGQWSMMNVTPGDSSAVFSAMREQFHTEAR
jgi:broad specificity phosphatase PhoE